MRHVGDIRGRGASREGSGGELVSAMMGRSDRQEIHILHIVPSFEVGGMENGLINLINGMDPCRFRHSLCVLSGEGGAVRRIRAECDVFKLRKLPGNDFSIPFRIARRFCAQRPNIVRTYSWGAWGEGLTAGWLMGRRVLIHSEHGFSNLGIHPPTLRRALGQRLAARFTNTVVAVTEPIRTALIERVGMRPEKVVTIENGVDTTRFVPRAGDDLRESLGIPKGVCLVGTVARLDPIKNIGSVIAALPELPTVHYLIVGEGPELGSLRALVVALCLSSRVHFLGARDDVAQLMSILDLFILPSDNEGCSNTLLEAMSTAVPVIASAVGGTPTLIKHYVTGILIAPNDARAMVRHIRSYLDDPSRFRDIGRAARISVMRNHSLAEMIRRYEQVCEFAVRKVGASH